jgi:hypothetical protein
MQADFVDEPGEVVGEALDGVRLFGLVARPVAAKVHRHDAVAPAEVLELGPHIAAVVRPAVNQQERRRPAPSLVIGGVDAVS